MKKQAWVVIYWNPKTDHPEMCQVRNTEAEAQQYLKNLLKRQKDKGAVLWEDPSRSDLANYMIRKFDVEN